MTDLEIVLLLLSFFDPLYACQLMFLNYCNQCHPAYKLDLIGLFHHHLVLIFLPILYLDQEMFLNETRVTII